ncbi:prepilin peptidase [Candidatus Dojkabacteria bacterium]|nr:prepilin peptidase [Candidatus Dojkabacteria bacterium]
MIGASFASFINVAASSKGSIWKNISRRSSVCEKCGKSLHHWELIPVFGWLFLQGKCSVCKERISTFHPVSELLLGGAFVILYLNYLDQPLSLVLFSCVTLGLYFIAVYDVFRRKIPNVFIFPLIIVAAIIRFTNWSMIPEYFGGALLYFSFFFLINVLTVTGLFPGVKKGSKGFGWGDSKFAIFLGLLLGFRGSTISLSLAIFAGGVIGAILMLSGSKRGTKIPFAPFLSLGSFIALVWYEEIWDVLMSYFLI